MSSLSEQARQRLRTRTQELADQSEKEKTTASNRKKERVAREIELAKSQLHTRIMQAVETGKTEAWILSLDRPGYRANWIRYSTSRRTGKFRRFVPRVSVHTPYRELVDFFRSKGFLPVAYAVGNEHFLHYFYLGVRLPEDAESDLGKGYVLPVVGLLVGDDRKIVPLKQ